MYIFRSNGHRHGSTIHSTSDILEILRQPLVGGTEKTFGEKEDTMSIGKELEQKVKHLFAGTTNFFFSCSFKHSCSLARVADPPLQEVFSVLGISLNFSKKKKKK